MLTAHPLRGVFFMLLSGFTFVLNDSMMKLAMVSLPPYEVLVLRGAAGAVFALLLLRFGHAPVRLNMIGRAVLLRAGLEAVAILTYIIALAHAPIGDVTAIFQTTPLLVILGMIFIHREATAWLRLGLVVAGFAGALLVAQPGQGTISPFVMLAFITAVFAALRDLAARQISSEVPAIFSTLILIITVLAAAFVCGMLFEQWHLPGPNLIAMTTGAGLMMMLGHHFTLLAYRNASAQAVAPFYYSFMLFAVILGYVIFGDVPNLLGVFGMAIIMASGLAVLALERRVNQDAYQHPDL